MDALVDGGVMKRIDLAINDHTGIFVICFLINYTTKFMFEKRSKELGTYMLLGIKKKEIAHLVMKSRYR